MNKKVIKLSCVSAALLSLFACGGGGGSSVSNPPPVQNDDSQGALKPAGSEEAFLSGFREAVLTRADQTRAGAAEDDAALNNEASAPGADSSDGDAGGNFTGTYTLDANVDEYDIVKYDGEHIFTAKSFGYSCCFIAEPFNDIAVDIALPAPFEPPQGEFEAVRILSTDPDTASAAYVGGIDMPSADYVMGMYLQNDQLITLSSPQFFGYYGDVWLDFGPWQNQATQFNIFDVSNVESVSKRHSIAIEGGFVESRRVGNDIIVITRHMPTLEQVDFYATTDAEVSNNETAVNQVSLEDIVPEIDIDGQVSRLFNAADCLVNNEPLVGRSGYYPVISSITRIPVNNPSGYESLCISEETHGIYVSEQAVYLTQMHGESWDITRVHKFGMGEDIDYRGSIDLSGYVWTGGQSDFRINEYQNQLRVVTTEFTGDSADRFDYTVYIVEESDSELALQLVSQLPNSDRPQEIGKPGEGLFGVRFFGERAYLVTFEQIDPLYVLDLSDASQPQIVGELEIPGVSEFLHPVNDELLLGLGALGNGDWRLKLELFDVSDLTAPVSLNSVVLGAQSEYSSSEALYNRHAFTYLAGDSVDRLSIPATISGSREGQYFSDHSLHLFEVDKSTNASTASLAKVGVLATNPEPDDDSFYPSNSRSIIHDDAVYFITGAYVWSAPWATSNAQQGPF